MKFLGKEATKIMNTLTELAGDGHVKIDNGKPDFMAVVVERLYEVDYGPVYSVTHYYEQNGDLMCDPDVQFLKVVYEFERVDAKPGTYYFPLTYRQDNLGIDQEAVVFEKVDGKTVTRCNRKGQADLVTFCNQWMRNIKNQQRI